MSITDGDYEILGSYLDGELAVNQCEALWRRLAAEPELSAELDSQREARNVRRGLFTAMEPSDQDLANLQRKLIRAAKREDTFAAASRMARIVCGVAACIVFGFTVGWRGRDMMINHSMASDQAPSGVHTVMDSKPAPAPNSGPYVVSVQDETGKVIASPQFGTYQEAQDWMNVYNKARQRQQQVQPVNYSASEPF